MGNVCEKEGLWEWKEKIPYRGVERKDSLQGSERNSFLLGMEECGGSFEFDSVILQAQQEVDSCNETIDSLKALQVECDKIDYILAASSGVLTGIMDVFLVGKPGESPVGEITDKWFEKRTMDFAKLSGWSGGDKTSAIRFLEKKFKVPYDQTTLSSAAKDVFNLNSRNHHFKSLGHNPSLLGLFFSILDQFNNMSHFVDGKGAFTLKDADGGFLLQGNSVPSKIFFGFVNWIGHLISDGIGSSGSGGRGMGIPSPLWTWTNDVIAIKGALGISPSEFNKNMNELAAELFEKGFDNRFQVAQSIPIVVNELVVRMFYSIRRLVKYFAETEKKNRSLKEAWNQCEPFKTPSVKRMLTIAHGTFCLVDLGDATIRAFIKGGGTFNPIEFFLRFNVAGVGRFTISLYGEAYRGCKWWKLNKESEFASKEKTIIEEYIKGLKLLAERYDDENLTNFVDDLKKSNMYKVAFDKSVQLAEKRNVSSEKILTNMDDVDRYFGGKI